ncbi:MAG: nicotinate-nucleotide adenylyltransferase [Saprospiraceae bacterium]|jgi:nicotinate-nucleotide adenylyltransferase
MTIGLFFGSFNPVHVGHMIIASHMVQQTNLDEVWMVVSPQNPFKEKKSLAPDYDRLHLLQMAIGDHTNIRASNIEFDLPTPSYTIDTLTYLKEKYPKHEFALIMGGDNIASFHKWKNYEKVLEQHEIYVYNRPGQEEHQFIDHSGVHFAEAPLLNLSASYIRQAIKDGHSIQYLVPDTVYQELLNSHLYRN